MKIPAYYFSNWSWPRPDEFVDFAEQRTGFVRDEGVTGLNYAEGQDEWDLSQPNPIPPKMLRIWWIAIYQNEDDVEEFISERTYLEALYEYLETTHNRPLAKRIKVLLSRLDDGPSGT